MKQFTQTEADRELAGLKSSGLFKPIAVNALAHGLSLPYVLAVCSRETNCRNIIGDNGHGVGVMQIDIQHGIAAQAKKDGSWQTDPAGLIAFGCSMLRSNIDAVHRRCPGLTDDQALKVAASAYNCGLHRALVGCSHGDSDRSTTGGDYGRDVMGRKAVFDAALNS